MAGLYWHGDISGHYSDTRSPSVTEAELANYLNILRVTLHRDHLPSCLPSLFMVRYLMIVASLSMAASVLASPLAPPCLVFTPPLPRCHCPVQSHVTCESHLMLLTSLTLSLSLSSAYIFRRINQIPLSGLVCWREQFCWVLTQKVSYERDDRAWDLQPLSGTISYHLSWRRQH